MRFLGFSDKTASFVAQIGYGGAMRAGAPGSGDLVRGAAAGAVAGATTVQAATPLRSGIIYRAGKTNPGNLTPRAGEEALSFRSTLSNPTSSGSRPVFRPGDHYIGIDVSKLPAGAAVLDNLPAGHVSVSGVTADQLKAAVVESGRILP
jgi:hypothetical protein